jgi:hypothetical protein
MTATNLFSVRTILRGWLTQYPVHALRASGEPVPWKVGQSIREHIANSLQALQGAEVRCDAVTGAEENLRGVLAEIDKVTR